MTDCTTWDYDNPLARAKGETRRAHEAFLDYERLGAGRSLKLLSEVYRAEIPEDHPLHELAEKYRRIPGVYTAIVPPTLQKCQLEKWSSRNQWQARLDRLTEIREAEREAIRRQRVTQIEERDWEQGQALRDKVAELLVELERFRTARVQETTDADGARLRIVTVKFKPTLTQLSQALKTGSELQRLAAGVATSNQRTVDRDGGDAPPVSIIEVVRPD